MPLIILILIGLVAGSFITALSKRFEKPKSMLDDRSRCLKCNHQLAAWDLIPIFSFVFLLGRCRYCKKKISWRYPLIELFTTILFILPALLKPYLPIYELVLYLILTIILVSILVIDLETMHVPDYLLYLGIFVALIFAVLKYILEGQNILDLLLGPSIGGGVFLFIVLLSREKWMGAGDIGIGVILGLVLAYPQILVNLFLSFTIGGIVGLFLLLAKKAKMKTEVPLGPFLIFGFFLAYFWGAKILESYLLLIYS